MSDALETIRDLLARVGSETAFSAHRAAAPGDLDLAVDGVGRVDLPVSERQARELCAVARLAPYGKGEETLLDREVRDTWEVPADRVAIDGRRWDRTLLPILDELATELGVRGAVKAELHSMLVYEPGQFFRPHQDSEKTDGMIGTLVVVLPSSHRGGELVVEHRGERATYRGCGRELSFVAFYSDCRHEARPVEEGYRVVLTYNLLAEEGAGDAGGRKPAAAQERLADDLAAALDSYFETPRPRRLRPRGEEPAQELPVRLVYLLDHQYTERGLSWTRLKGADAARIAVLRSAVEAIGGEMALALAEVHEIWGCMEPGWDDRWYGSRRSWRREDEEWVEDDPVESDPDSYELTDFIDGAITLNRWFLPEGGGEAIASYVSDDEAVWTTPSVELQAHASEYEGYMGNYGNTMDRWYRRAAVVLWPKERGFAVRARVSPRWGLEALRRAQRSGRSAAGEMAEAILSFWNAVRVGTDDADTFAAALEVAAGLTPEQAASLLRPFQVVQITPELASGWLALTDAHGQEWCRALLARWAETSHARYGDGADEVEWLPELAPLCRALRDEGADRGRRAAGLLLEDRWTWLRERFETALSLPPRQRDMILRELSGATLALLQGTAIADAQAVRGEILEYLCRGGEPGLLPCAVPVLRGAARLADIPDLEVLERHCVAQLESNLAQPPRREDDWSIALPPGCECALCERLGEFLADPSERHLEWPIAKEKRKHVHRRIDAHELPVRHETRRSGRPYTLVLTKRRSLFDREQRQRAGWREALDWLTGAAEQR